MEKYEIIRRNKNAYIVSRIPWLGITLTAIIQIWQRDGMDFPDMLLLQGLFALALIILEVPTGLLADLFDRRNLIIQGHIAIAIGLLVYSMAHGFYQFLFAEIIFAFGLAAISGADNATIWDTYKLDDDEISASKALANGKILMMASSAILIGFGGYIASLSLVLPFYIGILGYLVNTVLYFFSVEPERPKLEKMNQAWKGVIILIKNTNFIEVLIYFSINVVILRILFWSYIPKLQEFDVNRSLYGIVLAGANVVAVVASFYAKKHHESTFRITFGIFIFSGIGILMFIRNNTLLLFLLAIIFQQIARAFTNVIVPIKLNQNLESEIRASAASFMSMIGGLLYFISTFIFEILDLKMFEIMIVDLWILFIFFLLLSVTIYQRKQNTQSFCDLIQSSG